MKITLIVDIWEVEISIEMVLFFKSTSLIQVKEKKNYTAHIYIWLNSFLKLLSQVPDCSLLLAHNLQRRPLDNDIFRVEIFPHLVSDASK